MAFPQHVLEAIEHFQQLGGADFETIRLLTQPKSDEELKGFEEEGVPTIGDYEKMWATLEEHSLNEEKTDFHWVICFVEAVTKARSLPLYYYNSKQELIKLTDDLRRSTHTLMDLYARHDLDANLYHHCREPDLDGFRIYEDLAPIYQQELLDEPCYKLAFTELLKLMLERSLASIKNADDGRNIRNIEVKRFLLNLGAHNNIAYQQPLNEVLSVAAFAVYTEYYTEQKISNLLNRQPIQTI